MRREHRSALDWIRAFAVTSIAAAGLATIVGSGGGAGFPECDAWYCYTPPPPLSPSVTVQPEYATRQAGTSVTFTAGVTNASGDISYQWGRSFDGGSSFVDIAGATARSYSLSGVTLADDGAVLRVRVKVSSGSTSTWPISASARGYLAVAATPAVVFTDGEFLDEDWLVAPVVDSSHPAFAHADERAPAGGNPGAFRTMTEQLPQNGVAIVVYLSNLAAYDPATQGAIYVIDYAEDCIDMQDSELILVESEFVIEQAGHRYIAHRPSSTSNYNCSPLSWSAAPGMASLRREDFLLLGGALGGAACNVGETCPDFSATGKPIRLGFRRVAWGSNGDVIAHGIDNWKVSVWRR